MGNTVQVAVIGPGEASATEQAAARTIGAGLAEAGVVVVTGGRGGVMAAATAGARDADGVTLALLPGDDPTAAVEPPTVVVPTGLGEARNALVVRSANAVVAIGGAWGTLSEVALSVRRGTPVVGLDTWGLADDLAAAGLEDPIIRAATPEEALRVVLGIVEPEDTDS